MVESFRHARNIHKLTRPIRAQPYTYTERQHRRRRCRRQQQQRHTPSIIPFRCLFFFFSLFEKQIQIESVSAFRKQSTGGLLWARHVVTNPPTHLERQTRDVSREHLAMEM